MTNNILTKIMLFGVLIISISYLVYHYYDWDNGQIIVIYPDQSPTKIKPQDSGGILLPNANNIIYENLQQKKVSRNVVLQAEPEKPLNITQHKVTDNIDEIDSIDDILSNITEVDKTINPANVATIAQLASTSQAGLNIVKITETHRKIDEIAPKQRIYQIQLASVKSESEANQEGERLKKKYPKILDKEIIKIKKVKSDKGNYFYLLLIGDYNNISQAKAVCKKLASYQQNCIIAKY